MYSWMNSDLYIPAIDWFRMDDSLVSWKGGVFFFVTLGPPVVNLDSSSSLWECLRDRRRHFDLD